MNNIPTSKELFDIIGKYIRLPPTTIKVKLEFGIDMVPILTVVQHAEKTSD